MRIFESRITGLAYDPDFDRFEAAVSLIVKPGLGQPARRMRVRTSAPRTGTAPLEERIVQDAIRLAQALPA